MSDSSLLRLDGVGAQWEGRPVVQDVSFTIAAGEFLTLLGPNGSGKTTLLRLIAGLEEPAGGRIVFDGRAMEGVPAHRRRIGLLAQEPALFPRLTVLENVRYGLDIAGLSRPEADARVDELLALLHLEALWARRPDQISGGERQRVSLARTLAPRPKLVLLDEPFASLDVELKAELSVEFRATLAAQNAAAIHVTHDREEGLWLGDRVAVLLDGRLRQVARPAGLFAAPADAEVARFLGYNLLTWEGRRLAVHPDDLDIGPPAPGAASATVLLSADAGRVRITHLRGPNGDRWEARGPASDRPPAAAGPVSVRWRRSIDLGPIR